MHLGYSIDRRLRIAGIFVICGLLVEAICLMWARPIAFVVLVAFGGALIGIGVLFFLYSLVSASSHPAGSSGGAAGK
jgi:hypothetical protein